ncbi:hypothetical protein [Cohnella sp. 56]
MSAPKKKAPISRKPEAKEQINKRGLIIAGTVFGVIVIAMAVLLITNP